MVLMGSFKRVFVAIYEWSPGVVMRNVVEIGIEFEILKFGDWEITIWVLCEE
jgi:hypothetical protein